MALFPRLFEARSVSRATGSLDAYSDFWYNVAGKPSRSGVQISEKTALRYLAVFSCVSLIAGDVARLPLLMYQRKGNGKERITDHPLYDLLHNAPNPIVNSNLWRESGQGHLLLWGNKYARIERDKYTGLIKYFWPVEDPGVMNVKREKGKILYQYTDENGKKWEKLGREEVFHIPGFGFNGITGESMIGLAREAIGTALSAEEYGSTFYSEGTHPSMIVSIPPEVQLGDEQEQYKKHLKDTIAGMKNAHGIAVFYNGEKVDTINMPLRDAQFIESRDFQRSEIASFYHVPPHKIGILQANSNHNSLEQENQDYVDRCLIHWLTRWEKCISHQLLTEKERKAGLFFEFLVDGLLRGDSQSRAEHYKSLSGIGVYSINDIREKENMNPVEGGDQRFVPMNMVPLEKAGDMADATIIQKKTKGEAGGSSQSGDVGA